MLSPPGDGNLLDKEKEELPSTTDYPGAALEEAAPPRFRSLT
jgi:hypothetical protein